MSEAAERPIKSGVVINLVIIAIALVGIVVLVAIQLASGDDTPTVDPAEVSIRLLPVAEGLTDPVLLVGDGAGGMLVVEQAGRIRRLAADGTVDTGSLLDIRERVTAGGEQGLLGLALHPDFTSDGRFYVAYTGQDSGALSISEFTLEPGAHVALASTERVLLTIPQPYRNHNGGHVTFDPEGMLLVGVGDGGSAGDPGNNGQDPASLLGTLLRLDVDHGWPYAIPADNGFADVPGARPEIHAIGLRNPWRFTVDVADDTIYIGDVGQGRWEEVNVLPSGTREADFGWSEMEGADCYDGRACDPAQHRLPAVAYPHDAGETRHCSVIGGDVYRGPSETLPQGTYLFADYCSGTIWGVPAAGLRTGTAEPVVLAQLPADYGRITSFGRDDEGEPYLTTTGGYVLKLEPATDSQADASAAPA